MVGGHVSWKILVGSTLRHHHLTWPLMRATHCKRCGNFLWVLTEGSSKSSHWGFWTHEFCTELKLLAVLCVQVFHFSLAGSLPWPHCACSSCWLRVWLCSSVSTPGEIKSGHRLEVLWVIVWRIGSNFLFIISHSLYLQSFPILIWLQQICRLTGICNIDCGVMFLKTSLSLTQLENPTSQKMKGLFL